eukprot:353872-Chlamydomonas_euryale.AAC.10
MHLWLMIPARGSPPDVCDVRLVQDEVSALAEEQMIAATGRSPPSLSSSSTLSRNGSNSGAAQGSKARSSEPKMDVQVRMSVSAVALKNCAMPVPVHPAC